MPAPFWGDAVMTAVHLLNLAWHGGAPPVGHLRVFQCVLYTKDLTRYAEGAKAYRVLHPEMHVSRDVGGVSSV